MSTDNPGVRLGDLLTSAGLLKMDALREAMLTAKQQSMPVGRILITSGYLSENQLQAAVKAQSLLKDGLVDMSIVVKALGLLINEQTSLEQAMARCGWQRDNGAVTNKLGELLLEANIVSQEDFDHALSQCENLGLPLGRMLVLTNCLTEQMLSNALNAQVLLRDHKITRAQAIKGLHAAQQRQLPLESALADSDSLQLPSATSIRLGELLIEGGLIDQANLMNAVERGLVQGKLIGQILRQLNLISENDLSAALELQKMVAAGSLRRREAVEIIGQIHSGKASLQDILKRKQNSFDTDQESNKEELLLDQFLKIAGIITQNEIEKAIRIGSQDSDIFGKMLQAAGVMDEQMVEASLDAYALVSDDTLTMDQAMIALKNCQVRRHSLEEAFKDLGWSADSLDEEPVTDTEDNGQPSWINSFAVSSTIESITASDRAAKERVAKEQEAADRASAELAARDRAAERAEIEAAQRAAAAEKAAAEKVIAERIAAEERAASEREQRVAAERLAAQQAAATLKAAGERAAVAERVAAAERAATERAAAEQALAVERAASAKRAAAEQAAAAQAAAERAAAEQAEQAATERAAAERVAAAERAAAEQVAAEQVAAERAATERAAAERAAAERAATERAAVERAASERATAERAAAERAAAERAAAERAAAERAAREIAAAEQVAAERAVAERAALRASRSQPAAAITANNPAITPTISPVVSKRSAGQTTGEYQKFVAAHEALTQPPVSPVVSPVQTEFAQLITKADDITVRTAPADQTETRTEPIASVRYGNPSKEFAPSAPSNPPIALEPTFVPTNEQPQPSIPVFQPPPVLPVYQAPANVQSPISEPTTQTAATFQDTPRVPGGNAISSLNAQWGFGSAQGPKTNPWDDIDDGQESAVDQTSATSNVDFSSSQGSPVGADFYPQEAPVVQPAGYDLSLPDSPTSEAAKQQLKSLSSTSFYNTPPLSARDLDQMQQAAASIPLALAAPVPLPLPLPSPVPPPSQVPHEPSPFENFQNSSTNIAVQPSNTDPPSANFAQAPPFFPAPQQQQQPEPEIRWGAPPVRIGRAEAQSGFAASDDSIIATGGWGGKGKDPPPNPWAAAQSTKSSSLSVDRAAPDVQAQQMPVAEPAPFVPQQPAPAAMPIATAPALVPPPTFSASQDVGKPTSLTQPNLGVAASVPGLSRPLAENPGWPSQNVNTPAAENQLSTFADNPGWKPATPEPAPVPDAPKPRRRALSQQPPVEAQPQYAQPQIQSQEQPQYQQPQMPQPQMQQPPMHQPPMPQPPTQQAQPYGQLPHQQQQRPYVQQEPAPVDSPAAAVEPWEFSGTEAPKPASDKPKGLNAFMPKGKKDKQ